MENDSMQPDHEADDLHALLHEEYCAPRLDDQFSADLIARVQAEAAPSSMPTHRRSPLAIGLVVAAAAVLLVAVIWISNLASPGTNHEVAHRAKTDSAPSACPPESSDILKRVTDDGVDNMSLAESRSEALVIDESLVQNESEIASKPDSFTVEAIESENESLSATPLSVIQSGNQVEPLTLSLARRPLKQSVAEATVIVVTTALKSDLAPPNRPSDARENLITFKVARVLKGEFADKAITTRTPTDPKEFIEKEWVVMHSPQYMADKSRYAGLYNVKLEPEIDAILAGKR